MKQKARELRKDLFIVDTGDTHDGNINNCCVNFFFLERSFFLIIQIGNGLSDVTSPRGKLSQPLLTNVPYDILTIGISFFDLIFSK